MWTPLRELLVRLDGPFRTPRQLWWLAQGLWQQQIELLERAGPSVWLLTALRDGGRLDDAAEVARHLSDAPDTPGAGHWWLAARALEEDRPAQAVAAARRALELAADEPGLVVDASALLALSLQATGEPDEAVDVVSHGLAALADLPAGARRQELAPSTEALLWLATGRAYPEGSDISVTAHRRALELGVAHHRPALAADLARALHAAGDHGEAARVLRDSLGGARAADRFEALRLLGHQYLAHLDRPRDAVSELEQAVELIGEARPAPDRQVALQLELARAALEAREPARAAIAARAVLAWADTATPEQLTVADHRLGLALETLGDLENAVQALQSALGRCRDACVQYGGDAVPEALENEVTRDLRRVFGVHSSVAGSGSGSGGLSGNVAEGTSR